MASPTEITCAQLSRLIGTPECPTIIDVRTDEDFSADPEFIPSAIKVPFTDMQQLATRLSGGKVIVYCQKGFKISQGAAAVLRSLGVNAETLQGGHFAWRDANLPLIIASAPPVRSPEGHTVWVTRARPKIDRIACPWLIKRFVDPNAQFLFVSSSQVEAVAERFNATPFDIEGVFWSHRGDNCTFDTMLEEFGLHTKALDHLAKIIRGADTDNCDLTPQSAGLLAASLGYSRMYRDDLAQLEASLPLYDAFYRWSRDAVNETHTWPMNKGVNNAS